MNATGRNASADIAVSPVVATNPSRIRASF
jgi:hypothetical protein